MPDIGYVSIMSTPHERGPDRPAETSDVSPHQDPRSEDDVERGRETAKDVVEDPEVPDDEPESSDDRDTS